MLNAFEAFQCRMLPQFKLFPQHFLRTFEHWREAGWAETNFLNSGGTPIHIAVHPIEKQLDAGVMHQ